MGIDIRIWHTMAHYMAPVGEYRLVWCYRCYWCCALKKSKKWPKFPNFSVVTSYAKISKIPPSIGAATATARTKAATQAKYRDPVSGREWSGHGRQPGWIKDALAAGRELDDFAI